MSFSIQKEASDFVIVTLSDTYTYQDQQALERLSQQFSPAADGKGRVLIRLKQFVGWGKTGDWGNLDLMNQTDQHVGKIAVVGDPKWRTEMLMFLAAGLRQAEVEYFLDDEEDQARAWLGVSALSGKKI